MIEIYINKMFDIEYFCKKNNNVKQKSKISNSHSLIKHEVDKNKDKDKNKNKNKNKNQDQDQDQDQEQNIKKFNSVSFNEFLSPQPNIEF